MLLCAADTFRAAAVEQLEVWGERTQTRVIRQNTGADPSAVMFDALQAAKSGKTDYVIIDTAGRLQTKTNLMAELEKMRRTATRVIPDAPHEVFRWFSMRRPGKTDCRTSAEIYRRRPALPGSR